MSLSAQDMLTIWECGQQCGPVYQALILLTAGCPEIDWETAPSLSVGERDRILFKIREEAFGPLLASYVKCPVCTEALEFEIAIPEILIHEKSNQKFRIFGLPEEDLKIDFRLPDSRDLLALGNCSNIAEARSSLLQSCIIGITRKDIPITIQELTEPALKLFSEYVSDCDPGSEIIVKTMCPACGHSWDCTLDIASFLWTEISLQAKRLLRDVHLLASAYGWGEQEILSMPAIRRQYYLEMVLSD